MGNRYNISIVRGDSLALQLNATDSAGNYINLSGYNARAYVKSKYSETGILTNLNAIIHNSYVSGRVDISISGGASSQLPVGVWPFDCEIYQSGANIDYVSKFIRGYLLVDMEATY